LKILISEEEESLMYEIQQQEELLKMLNKETKTENKIQQNNHKEETEILKEIEILNQENEGLELSYKNLTWKLNEIDKKKRNYWSMHSQNFQRTKCLLESRSSIDYSNEYFEYVLENISKDPLNKLFIIWHDGDYGTMNGLRFGRHVEPYVPWEEFNAAFGSIALLLDCLAKKLKYSFSKYQFLHFGSESKILNLLTSSKESL
jgi:beclin